MIDLRFQFGKPLFLCRTGWDWSCLPGWSIGCFPDGKQTFPQDSHRLSPSYAQIPQIYPQPVGETGGKIQKVISSVNITKNTKREDNFFPKSQNIRQRMAF